MMKVLLCGGGNAIHVLTSYIGSLAPDVEVYILSLLPGEAQRLQKALPEDVGVECQNNFGETVFGKPVQISDDPAAVVPESNVVILALPSFTHDAYLTQMKPFLPRGVMLGSMPGQSGFDLVARHILGDDFCNASTLFGLDTLPWACRIIEYGKSVQVLGTKKEIGAVFQPPEGHGDEAALQEACQTLQKLIGPLPVLKPSSNFLAVSLTNPNIVHPTISYGFYRDKGNATTAGDLKDLVLEETPLFYTGVDDRTGQMLSDVSDEVLELCRVLQERYPSIDLSGIMHLKDILLRYYSDDIEDKTNVGTMLRTSRAHRGLVHPVLEVELEDGTKRFKPNFQYRYFTEDLPCGMIFIRGVAELANVKTPIMDEVILWCQTVMEKEFLVDGKVAGKDVETTRCPQKFGCTDLDAFMASNHYL